MFQEFKEFIRRGSVFDMAVGIIIGAAFGKIVSSFVGDVLMPPIGLLVGHVDFSNLFLNLGGSSVSRLRRTNRNQRVCIDREPRGHPGVEASGQRTHQRESLFKQRAGHTGRRGFVGSGAVEDDLPVLWKLRKLSVDFRKLERPCARDAARVSAARRPRPDV